MIRNVVGASDLMVSSLPLEIEAPFEFNFFTLPLHKRPGHLSSLCLRGPFCEFG